MKRVISSLIVVLACGLSAGCAGEFDVFGTSGDDGVIIDSTDDSSDDTTDETDDPTTQTTDDDEDLSPAFELPRDQVKLLPFHVRLEKVARVAGVETDDPIFADMRRNRYDLGDHDFAQGIGPDLNWNASKMSLWVESLMPVCSSGAMTMAYPALPEHLNELVLAAYGREVTEEDLAMVDAILTENALPEAERYQAVCLAILTSTEFVAQ